MLTMAGIRDTLARVKQTEANDAQRLRQLCLMVASLGKLAVDEPLTKAQASSVSDRLDDVIVQFGGRPSPRKAAQAAPRDQHFR